MHTKLVRCVSLLLGYVKNSFCQEEVIKVQLLCCTQLTGRLSFLRVAAITCPKLPAPRTLPSSYAANLAGFKRKQKNHSVKTFYNVYKTIVFFNNLSRVYSRVAWSSIPAKNVKRKLASALCQFRELLLQYDKKWV